MSNELVKYQSLTPSVWEMITAVAPAMHKSRLFGVSLPEQAAAIMLKGYEIGLSLTASFEFIHVIGGKPGLSPRGMLALIQQSPELDELKITDEPGKCTVWMKRKNGFEYQVTYTIEDAQKAGLVKADSGWQKYEANMLRWRAVGFCADVVFPDVIGGMKRADELGAAITPSGDIIEGQWQTTIDNSASPVTVTSEITVTLDELLTKFSPEDVLTANGGKIPQSNQEVQKTAEALGWNL